MRSKQKNQTAGAPNTEQSQNGLPPGVAGPDLSPTGSALLSIGRQSETTIDSASLMVSNSQPRVVNDDDGIEAPDMERQDPVGATVAVPNLEQSENGLVTPLPSIGLRSEPAGGIEILVKMAESGEIDPKNIDIIDVTDKFLMAIKGVAKENLRQSGKIIFHASVLLRMKAEAMLAAATADADGGDDFLDFGEDDGNLIYDSRQQAVGRQITLQDLERALVRRANNRQNRQRKVTLDQLIAALREAERLEKVRAEKQPRRDRINLEGQHNANDVDDLLDLAHDEDIESTIMRVETILKEFTQTGELMQLLRIIQLLGGHGDWVDAFLAVLFLSNAGKITLEQQDFYGPLFILRNDENAQPIAV